MDWEFIISHLPMYTDAALLTLSIGILGILFSLAVGLISGLLLYFKTPVLWRIASVYVELARNTPLLVQLFFLYFGLPKIGIIIPSAACAVIGLTFLGGGYMAEAFRSGFEAVETIQYESALSLGFTNLGAMRHVIFMQAFVMSLPSILANVIFLIKETSVFSVVALADLMYVAKDLIGLYYNTNEALFMLVCFYLLILLPVSLLASVLEKRLRYV
ncbi:MAG: amino acid ABC transporter permease [Treponema sp.]|nr:amino acid ABC transporter permease [Treponema sp.]